MFSKLRKRLTKDETKKKILSIESDIPALVKPFCSEKISVMWYGAYHIDPKHLVFWVCIKSDQMKHELQGNIELNTRLRALLDEHDYPTKARQFVHIGFESQETVDRESDGHWFYHFK